MWRWYENAAICYIYLADVCSTNGKERARHQFRESEWFRRGWTLQELLAPRECFSFSADWSILGDKRRFVQTISQVTGIDEQCLTHRDSIGEQKAAVKMHWASRRRTTRPEDMAYSLLGLFDINMPLLYGEGGAKAFLRLQLAILEKTLDWTLLLWRADSAPERGPLADGVANFTEAFTLSEGVVEFENMKTLPLPYRYQCERLIVEWWVEEYVYLGPIQIFTYKFYVHWIPDAMTGVPPLVIFEEPELRIASILRPASDGRPWTDCFHDIFQCTRPTRFLPDRARQPGNDGQATAARPSHSPPPALVHKTPYPRLASSPPLV